MTQAQDLQPIRLQLTAMTLPDGRCDAIGQPTDTATWGVNQSNSDVLSHQRPCTLVVYPGEASELLVQLENVSDRDLEIDAHVTGTFPNQWCRLGLEGQSLPRGSTMEAVLYFQIAADFFESPVGHQAGQPLTLDYNGDFELRYRQPEQDNYTAHQTAAFQVFVRPHSLYLDFLPDIYREVDFVGRFLKIFEQTFEPNVQMWSNLWAYIDPKTAPEAMLPFLAHWVGWPLTPQLSLQRQRQLIAGAVELYRWRGTRRGLRYAIHLFTDLPLDEDRPETEKSISIQEIGGRGFVLGETRLGRDATMGGGQPYHFRVHLRPQPDQDLNLPLIYQVIDKEKPAFCTYELYMEEQSV